MIIQAKAPLRLGLAGGGTDFKDFSDTYGGRVLNVTISLYVNVTLKIKKKNISFHAKDLNLKETFNKKSLLSSNSKEGLCLHRETYKFIFKKYNKNKFINLEILTNSDIPQGSGLGGSSTLVVAMIKAYSHLLNFSISKHQIANYAYIIERRICKLKGGKQDQFSASYGGLNIFEFKKKNTFVYPIKIEQKIIKKFENHLILYYSGISRDNPNLITDQIKRIKNGSSVQILKDMKKEAYTFVKYLKKGDFDNVFKIINKGWSRKVKTGKYICNADLNKIISCAKKNGVISYKVSGAGGGGFIIFFLHPKNRLKIKKKVVFKNSKIYNVKFTFDGAESWKV